MTAAVENELSARDRAILRAVGAGRVELVAGAALRIDGRCCCDQAAARRLVHDGLVGPGPGGAAVVTAAGLRLLTA